MKRSDAVKFAKAVKIQRADATDKTASESVELYPVMQYDGGLIKAGTRINWDGKIMKASVDLWDRTENDPENAPTLWEEIQYREGIRVIPEVITVTTMFSLNELGWWGDTVYRSLIDGNVHNPEQYPQGWEVVE